MANQQFDKAFTALEKIKGLLETEHNNVNSKLNNPYIFQAFFRVYFE
jgi:hypothetical protein